MRLGKTLIKILLVVSITAAGALPELGSAPRSGPSKRAYSIPAEAKVLIISRVADNSRCRPVQQKYTFGLTATYRLEMASTLTSQARAAWPLSQSSTPLALHCLLTV